jgi:hypothetical protein
MTMSAAALLDELKGPTGPSAKTLSCLRVFEKGYSAAHAHQSFTRADAGHLIDYKKQRFAGPMAIQDHQGSRPQPVLGKGTKLKNWPALPLYCRLAVSGWRMAWNIFFTAGALFQWQR